MSSSVSTTSSSAISPKSHENQPLGVTVRHTKSFLRRRNLITEKRLFQSNCLQSRLKKLLDVGRNPSLTLPQLKELEQSIIAWEPDELVDSCQQCKSRFTTLLNRKHHCRLCGHVICRSCSVHEIIQESLSIRLCSACMSILNMTRKPIPPPLPRIASVYRDLSQLRTQINATAPKLATLVSKLKSNAHNPANDPINRRTRTLALTFKKDMDTDIKQITSICESIANMHVDDSSSAKLHRNIVQATTSWIQDLMLIYNQANDALTIRAPPPPSTSNTVSLSPVGSSTPRTHTPNVPLVAEKYSEANLAVLIEQYTQLLFFLKDATANRQLESVRTLQSNVDLIVSEIQTAELRLYGESRFQP